MDKRIKVAVSVSAVVVVAALLYAFLPTDARDKTLRALVEGLMNGGVYALVALSVVVVFKSTKIFNLTFGAVIMFLAYFGWWLGASVGLPPWLSAILTMACGAFIGIVINRVFMRPLIGDTGLASFIVCIILGLSVIYGLAIVLFKGSPQIMNGLLPSGTARLGPVIVSYGSLIAFAIATSMCLIFAGYFRYTKMGLKMRVVSEDVIVAQSLGVNVRRIYDVSWAVGGLMAAVCGLLLGTMYAVTPSLSGFSLARGFPVLLLGGMDSITGAFLGAFIIAIAEAISSAFIDPYVTGFREILPYAIMLIILILRPNGLFGSKEIRRI